VDAFLSSFAEGVLFAIDEVETGAANDVNVLVTSPLL